MASIQPFLFTIARLLILTCAGYILFRNRFAQELILKPLLFVTMNIFLPIFFIHSFSFSWEAALTAEGTEGTPGWILMLSFFIAAFVMMFLQWLIGYIAVCKWKLIKTDFAFELLLMSAINNNAFLPFAILKPVVPPIFIIYMFFYTLSFNLVAWTIVAPCMQRKREQKKSLLSAYVPLAGLLLGLILAAFGIYKHAPQTVKVPFHIISCATLDMILFLLGGILAGIPNVGFSRYKEFGPFIALRMMAFPALLLIAAALIPFDAIVTPDLCSAMKLTIVLEAAVPPASLLMLIAAAYGEKEQVDFMGNGMIMTYAVSAVTMPVFLLIAAKMFY